MADVAAEAPLVAQKAKKGPRVERRGRFTITDIEPDSPASASSTMARAPTYDALTLADADTRDSVAEDEDGASGDHHESGEDGDVEGDDEDTRAAGRGSLLSATPTTSERISPFGSAVFERSTSVSTARAVDENTEPAGLEAALDGESVDQRARSPTIDETPDNRRVKRKGRFTIIELSSDSPRSRRNSAEEFSNTTSISVTSVQVTQANAQNQISSPVLTGSYSYVDTSNGTSASAMFARRVSENNTTSTRTSRSMVEASRRGRENDPRRANSGSSRRSSARMRSVSPLRERGSTNGSSLSSRHHLSASYGSAPSTPFRAQTFDPLQVTTSPYLKPKLLPSSNGVSTMSLSSSYSSVSGTTPTASVTPTNGSSVEKRYELGANRRHLASRQKAITISAEQFIQQQHTIASLIRQQQDLKQLIGVLAEQQQHLVSMPKQLADFRLDQTQSDAQEDTMREVQLQVGALSRANEALQKLLSEAEQDASERTMEIECLSNENNELRYRFSHMERRYHEEKKRSFALEQELQRTRRALYSARHKDKNDVQKQHQKLSTRVSSREMEDPIEEQTPVAKQLV